MTQAIDESIAGVDEAFVARRTALVRAAPDLLRFGLNADPRDPAYFMFNTWRHFGGATRWRLPGVVGDDDMVDADQEDEGVRPDAVRRLQPEWNMGAGLIMPERKRHEGYEVLVTLDVDAMEVLCADANWRKWARGLGPES
jgi:hypothetical protein